MRTRWLEIEDSQEKTDVRQDRMGLSEKTVTILKACQPLLEIEKDVRYRLYSRQSCTSSESAKAVKTEAIVDQ